MLASSGSSPRLSPSGNLVGLIWRQWQVSRATAQRDIADLKARDLIEFVGARRTGFYRLTKQA